MAYRKLNIAPELLSFAKFVLDRDGIPYKVAADGTLKAKLDDEGEEIMIEDAMCERQRAEFNSECPVYSYRTMCDEEKFARLQRLNWPDDEIPESAPFHVLHEDEEPMMEEVTPFTQDEVDELFPGVKLGMPIDDFLELFVDKDSKNREIIEELKSLRRQLEAQEEDTDGEDD